MDVVAIRKFLEPISIRTFWIEKIDHDCYSASINYIFGNTLIAFYKKESEIEIKHSTFLYSHPIEYWDPKLDWSIYSETSIKNLDSLNCKKVFDSIHENLLLTLKMTIQDRKIETDPDILIRVMNIKFSNLESEGIRKAMS